MEEGEKKGRRKGPEKKQREAGGAEKHEKGTRHQKTKRPQSTHRQKLEGIIEEVGTRAASHRKRQRADTVGSVRKLRNFLSGPVVKTLLFHCGGMGSISVGY